MGLWAWRPFVCPGVADVGGDATASSCTVMLTAARGFVCSVTVTGSPAGTTPPRGTTTVGCACPPTARDAGVLVRPTIGIVLGVAAAAPGATEVPVAVAGTGIPRPVGVAVPPGTGAIAGVPVATDADPTVGLGALVAAGKLVARAGLVALGTPIGGAAVGGGGDGDGGDGGVADGAVVAVADGAVVALGVSVGAGVRVDTGMGVGVGAGVRVAGGVLVGVAVPPGDDVLVGGVPPASDGVAVWVGVAVDVGVPLGGGIVAVGGVRVGALVRAAKVGVPVSTGVVGAGATVDVGSGVVVVTNGIGDAVDRATGDVVEAPVAADVRVGTAVVAVDGGGVPPQVGPQITSGPGPDDKDAPASPRGTRPEGAAKAAGAATPATAPRVTSTTHHRNSLTIATLPRSQPLPALLSPARGLAAMRK